MSKHPHHTDPPSGPNQTLSAKTGIRMTVPEFASVVVVIALAVLGWARLDWRTGRIEERLSTLEGRPASANTPSAPPIIADHVGKGVGP